MNAIVKKSTGLGWVLGLLLAGLPLAAHGQWNIVNKRFSNTRVQFDIGKAGLKPVKGFVFFDSEQGDSARYTAYLPLKKQRVTGIFTLAGRKVLAWKVDFPQPLTCDFDSTVLLQRIYVANIDRYEIFLHSADDRQWYRKEIRITYEKYQTPCQYSLAEWERVGPAEPEGKGAPVMLLTPAKKKSRVDKLVVVAHRKKDHGNPVFAVADLKIHDAFAVLSPAQALFFYQFNNKRRTNYPPQYTYTKVGNTFPIALVNASKSLFTPNEFYFYPDTVNHAGMDVQGESLNLIRYVFEKYPFYKEHRVDKPATLRAFDQIAGSNIPFAQKVDSLRNLVGSFNDGHFYIAETKKEDRRLTAGPVHVKEFFDDVYVAAVFDKDLSSLVPGMQIVAVDGRPVGKVIDSLALTYRGTPELRRSRAISHLLYREKGDSAVVTATDRKDTLTATVLYNRKVTVPANFTPVHGAYKVYDRHAYLRSNVWQPGDWLRLYNHGEELKKMKGIIFDLRRNPGGSGLEALQVVSCFIDKPIVFTHDKYEWNQNTTVAGTTVIYPNRFLSLRHLRVFILVDERTACASESFVALLKQHADAVVIGPGKTAGSFAAIEVLHLPGGIDISMNGVSKLMPSDPKGIENEGVEPDVYVPLTCVQDLYPYQDKVLSIALHLAKFY